MRIFAQVGVLAICGTLATCGGKEGGRDGGRPEAQMIEARRMPAPPPPSPRGGPGSAEMAGPDTVTPVESTPPAEAPTSAAKVDSPRITAPPRPLDTRPWAPVRPESTIVLPPGEGAGATPRQGGKWTAGLTSRKRDGSVPAILQAIRTARHEGWDRVVLEFEGAVPGYEIEYVDRPVRRCGSGDATDLAGDGWLEIRVTPAHAHTEAGVATVERRERHFVLPVLREMEMTCDFEAHVTVVLGVASPNPYRVTELSSPARLVVDVRR